MSRVQYSVEQLKKLGLVEKDGVYVPVKSLVAKKVEKIEANNMVTIKQVVGEYLSGTERQTKDRGLATAYAMHIKHQMSLGIDPVATINTPVRTYIKDDKLLQELIDVAKFYSCKILTEKTKVNIKPLSVNDVWKGRRFKTDQYTQYALAVSLLLPNNLIIPEGLLRVYYEFGLSSNGGDWDNPVKPFQDIIQEKYKFNDSRIMEATVRKAIVKKGQEYISFKIESL
jgi:Holliday junction resolvase RusA-like endonuclease